MTLQLAPGLELPDNAVSETFAMLGRRGSGKTNTAVVMAEEMLAAAHVIHWIDPVGVAWGLRSKFKILIAGGEKGDIPLEPGNGELMAEFLVDNPVPCIMEISGFGEAAMKRFVGDFGTRFYLLKNPQEKRTPVHLFFDEADEFAPQQGLKGEAAKSLGAMQNLIRRGRSRGIGTTLISQRSAVINKSVLTQTEVLFAMQTTGPQDLDAIKAWIQYHGTAEECAQIVAALPKLQQGEAFVYSPGWLKILKRVKIRARKTFDSSRTPGPGEQRTAPKSLEKIDLSALKGKIAESIERAKENDPAVLKARVKKLERELQAAKDAPIDLHREAELILEADKLRKIVCGLLEAIQSIAIVVNGQSSFTVQDEAIRLATEMFGYGRSAPPAGGAVAIPKPEVRRPVREPSPREKAINGRLPEGSGLVDGPGQKILNAMAWWESIGQERPLRGQVAFVADYAANGGSFKTYLSRLSTAGHIECGGGMVSLTESGRALAVCNGAATSLADYHRMLLDVVKDGPLVKILECMIQDGAAMPAAEVARRTGYEANGGSFKTYLSRISSLGLIQRSKGVVYGTSLLFPEGLE